MDSLQKSRFGSFSLRAGQGWGGGIALELPVNGQVGAGVVAQREKKKRKKHPKDRKDP